MPEVQSRRVVAEVCDSLNDASKDAVNFVWGRRSSVPCARGCFC